MIKFLVHSINYVKFLILQLNLFILIYTYLYNNLEAKLQLSELKNYNKNYITQNKNYIARS